MDLVINLCYNYDETGVDNWLYLEWKQKETGDGSGKEPGIEPGWNFDENRRSNYREEL